MCFAAWPVSCPAPTSGPWLPGGNLTRNQDSYALLQHRDHPSQYLIAINPAYKVWLRARAMLAAIATAHYPAYRALAKFVVPVMDSDGPQP